MAKVTRFIALLRAINVGGTGMLAMRDLKALCEDAGFHTVRTYIASGNVVFSTDQSADEAQAILEYHLLGHAGKPIPTFRVRKATLWTASQTRESRVGATTPSSPRVAMPTRRGRASNRRSDTGGM